MTIIAWDGKVLAGDRLGDAGGLARSTTKVIKFAGGLYGSCGSSSAAVEMLEWIKAGENPETCPAYQRTDDYQGIILVRPDRSVWVWGRGPYPFRMEDPFTAMGSGRDFAIAAMYLGKDAIDAVKIANKFDTGCGMGVDSVTFG